MYDMHNMAKLKKYGELAPEAWKAFVAFDKAVLADGALTNKTKELDCAGRGDDHAMPRLHRNPQRQSQSRGLHRAGDRRSRPRGGCLVRGAAVTHGTHCLT